MTRDELAAYLDDNFAALALATVPEGTASSYDPIDYYASAIDAALRALGTAEADLPSSDVGAALLPDYLALGEYYALVLLCRRLAPLCDATVSSAGRKLSQVYAQARQLLADAKATVEGRGYAGVVGSAAGAAAFSSGRLVLDSLEPDALADVV